MSEASADDSATTPPEEQARANFYGLVAHLFHGPPDRAMLATLANAGVLPSEQPDSALALAWEQLSLAAAAADAETVREEYESLFIGTGKSAITLYTSAYTVKTALDNPLVDIRAFMGRRGLARHEQAFEPEDHIAALCEIMRHLVAEQHAALEAQRPFFSKFIAPGGFALCDAIERHPDTAFYRHVAKFAHAFLELEQFTMEML